MPPLEMSVVQIPVAIDLRPIFNQVEKAVPGAQRASKDWTVVGENAVGDIGVKYEIWRDPLQLAMQGDRARINGRVRYWFQFAQRVPKPLIGGSFWQALGSCGVGEPPREAGIAMEVRASWTPEWRLAPSTTILPVTYANKCQVTFLKYDVTDRVNEAFTAGLRQGKALVDAKIAEVGNFKAIAEKAWRQLQEPIELGSGLWFSIDPIGASASQPAGSGSTVTTTLGFNGYAAITSGGKPKSPARPLPKLAAGRPAEGFHTTIEGSLSFDDASRRMAKALIGQSYTKVGHTVTVADASVYGAGDRAVVSLALKGDLNGTIFLVGEPAYDPAKNVLYLRDLDYSLETGQTLANVADWLFHGAFRSSIAEGTRWELGDTIAQARRQLERSLNRQLVPNVNLRATVSAIRPVGVFMTDDAFKARVAIDGALKLDIVAGR